MNSKLFKLVFAFLFFISATGCKRENLLTKETASVENQYAAKIKAWYESLDRTKKSGIKVKGASNTVAERGISSKIDIRDGDPIWENTKYFSNTKIYVTPIKFEISASDKNFTMYKYLIATEDNTSNIEKGVFFYLLVNNNKTAESFTKLLPNDLPEDFFSLKTIPAGLTGTVIKYDIDYKLIESKIYENANEVSGKGNILSYIDNKAFYIDAPNYPSDYAKIAVKCDSYYLVTFDPDGNIISVFYLYTSCEPGDGSSGVGGGGNPTTPSSCDMTSQEAINRLNFITSDEIYDFGGSTLGQEGQPDRFGIIRAPKICSVGLRTLHFWGNYEASYTAYFKGIVYKSNSYSPWKWENFEYNYSGLSAGVVAPCFAVTPTVNTSWVISSDKSMASVDISYQMLITCSCVGGIQAAPVQSNSFSTIFPSQ